MHAQLLAMSAATIDRLLAPFKRSMYPEGKSTTRSRRNQYTEAVPIMSRIPAIDWQPGLVAIDTVAHCGNSAKGQYAFTLTATDDSSPTLHEPAIPAVAPSSISTSQKPVLTVVAAASS